MAIQNRRGNYTDFDPTKMVAGEFAVVQNGDPDGTDGEAVYFAPKAGKAKRLVTADDVRNVISGELEDIIAETEAALADDVQRAEDAADSVESSVTQIATNTADIADIKEDLEQLEPGLSAEAKVALLACFENVAWANQNGQTYYDALVAALRSDKYPRITVAFDQGNHIVYAGTSIDALKEYITVTYYEDSTSAGQVISGSSYTLSGELTTGTKRILVAYNNLTAVFNVTVVDSALPSGYTPYDYIYVNTPDKYNTDTAILRNNQIQLPITGDKNTYKYETFVEITASEFPNQGIFGGRQVSGNANGVACYITDTWTKFDFMAHGSEHKSDVIPSLAKDKIAHVLFNPSANPTEISIDDTSYTQAWADSTKTMTAELVYFGNPAPNASNAVFQASFQIRIGRLKAYDTTGEIACDLIPCANASGKYGVYDTVSESFLTSKATNTYICGNWR